MGLLVYIVFSNTWILREYFCVLLKAEHLLQERAGLQTSLLLAKMFSSNREGSSPWEELLPPGKWVHRIHPEVPCL